MFHSVRSENNVPVSCDKGISTAQQRGAAMMNLNRTQELFMWCYELSACDWLHLRAGYKGRICVWSWTTAYVTECRKMSGEELETFTVRICTTNRDSRYSDSPMVLSRSVEVLGILSRGMFFREKQLPGHAQGSFKSKPGKSSLVNGSKTQLGL